MSEEDSGAEITPRAKKSKDLVRECIGDIERAFHHFERHRTDFISGICTGFVGLDSATLGLKKDDITIIGGRTEDGLTDFALSLADNFIKGGYRVLYCTGNKKEKEVVNRLLSVSSNVNGKKLYGGNIAEPDFPRLMIAAKLVTDHFSVVDRLRDFETFSVETRHFYRGDANREPIVFLDRFQNLLPMDERESLYRPARAIAGSLRDMSGELGLPIIVLSEMKKLPKKNVPTGADLRDFGAFEYDPLTLLLKTVSYSERSDAHFKSCEEVNAYFENNPYFGESNCVPFTYIRNTGRFESAAKVCDDDVPRD